MKNMLRRNLALLLAVVMILSCAPLDGMAAVIGASQLFDQFADQLATDYSGGASIARIVQPPAAVDTYVFKVDEETIATQKVKKGDVLYEPAAPSQDGYKFTGWRDAAGSAPVFGPVTAEATGETYTYTAQFDQVYYVFFMDDQGRVQITREGTAGDAISTQVTIKLQNAQAAVTGWYYDAALTQPVQEGHVTLSGANITLWPKVEEGYYLTFETNGGTYYPPAFYMPGKPTVDPGVPQKAGYSFTGWKDETGASFTFGSALTADKTLTAQWQANQNTQYTVIHWMENANDDGYSFKESEEKTGTTGAPTAAAARNYTGFTAQTITQTAIAADGSTIVNVQYKRNVYEVKFYSARGWGSSPKEYTDLRITAKYGASIGDKWPTYDGSNTWATNENGSGPYQVNIDTMPLNGANFYGPKTGSGSETAYYYVEVLPGETGTVVGGKSYKLHHSDTSPGTGYTVTVEDQYPITGYTFTTDGSTAIGGRYNNAKFYYTRNSYNIIYMNGGSEVTSYRTSVLFEQTIPDAANKPAPTPPMGKENYTFEGWYDDPAGQMLHVFSGKMPAQNITVYAKWVPPTVSGTAFITMAGNGSAPITIAYGGTINPDDLPTPTAPEGDGWEFVAWATKAGDVYTPFNFDTKIYKDIELYPYYVNKNQYQVTYHPGEGTGTVEDTRRYASGAEADVKAAAGLTPPAGKVFVGWKVGSTDEIKQPGDKLTITGNMTLTAQWGDAPAAVTLTYYGNGGKTADGQTSTSVTHENNATISTLGSTAFTRRGYTLTGWNTQANGQGDPFNCGASVLIDSHGDNALYAVWALDAGETVTVTYASEDAQKGTVSHTEDTIQIVSGDPVTGSTATANPGYTFVGWYKDEARISREAALTAATAKASLNKDADGLYADTTYIARFTERTDLSYTVHYYWNGTTTPVAESKTVDGQTYLASITESPKPVDGCTPVSTASQTITIGAETNEIIFYYYKNVELTAKGGNVTYDGKEHTVSGFTGAPEAADFSAIQVGARGTNAGTYPAAFLEGTVGTVDANGKYIVTKAKDGALVITPKAVTVNVTGRHTTHVYDGKAHTAEGFDTDAPAGVTVALAKGETAYAQRTDAGTTSMGLTRDSFVVTSDNYDVTIGTVTDGYVTITPVTDEVIVTITESSGTVTYDGKPHSVYGYQEMKANNTLYNVAASVQETPTAAWTATGTDVGEYPVGIKAEDFKNINPNFTNVKFEINDKSLTITPVTAKVTVTVTEKSDTVTYDGTEHTVTGYKSITADNTLYNVKASVQETPTAAWTATGTDAGEYPVGIKAGDFENINKNFTNVEFEIVDGLLKIDPVKDEVTVTIVGNHATVLYNAREHTVQGYTATSSNPLFNVDTDFTYGQDGPSGEAAKAKAKASGVNVERHEMGLQSRDFVTVSQNFQHVTYAVTDGYLDIEKRPVVVEVANSNKVYGEADPAFANATLRFYEGQQIITPNTEMQAELAGIDLTVHRTDVGNDTVGTHEDVLVISKTAEELRVQYPNYLIGVNPGDFEITATEESLIVRADNYDNAYDGNAHGVVAKAYVNNTRTLTEAEDAQIKYWNEATGAYDLDESPAYTNVKSATPGDRVYTVRFQATLDGLTAEGSANVLIAPQELVFTSNSASRDYTGQPLTSPDVTLSSGHIINGEIYDYKATGTVTNAYDGEKGDGVVTNTIVYSTTAAFKPVNYEIVLESGKLEINPREVKLTSQTKSKEYDGTPLTMPHVTIGPNGFVEGEVTDIRATGSVTYVTDGPNHDGKAPNTIEYTPAGNFDARNYHIVKNEGELSITRRTGTMVIETLSDSKVYDGSALYCPNQTLHGSLAEGDRLVVSNYVSDLVNVGSKLNRFESFRVEKEAGQDVTANYTFGEPIYGTLEITARPLTITVADNTVTYDGQHHGKADPAYTVNQAAVDAAGKDNGVGLVNPAVGDKTQTHTLIGTDIAFTAVNAGTYENQLNMVKDNVKILSGDQDVTGNYAITILPGTLTINQRPVTITANSLEYDYNYESPVAHPAQGVERYSVNEGLLDGDTVTAEVRYDGQDQQTLIGAYDAVVQEGVAIKSGEADVTANYAITLLPGLLKIKGDKIAPDKTTPQQVESNYKLGDTIPFTITVKNVSTAIVENIIVEDPNAILVAGQGYSVSEDGHTATILSLAPDAQVEIQAQHVVTEADILAGTVGNTATVAWENTTRTVEAKTEEIEEPNGALGVTKETTSTPKNGKTYALGETITYKITVTNTGNLTAKNIQVTDSLSAKEGQVIATIDSLAPGASQEIPFAYVVTEQDILNGKVVNEAAAKGETDDPDKKPEGGDEKEDETDDVDATLEVVKTSNKQEGQKAKLGETIEYTITVTNKGNVAFRNVKVDDELTGLHETIDELGVGASERFTTTYTVTEEDILKGHVLNEATAAADPIHNPKTGEDEIPKGSDEVTDETVAAEGALGVTKETTSTPKNGKTYALGETITYKITVTNTGNLTAKNIQVTDSLSAKEGQVIATIDSLAPGASQEIPFAYVVTEQDILNGKVVNEAAAKGETDDPDKKPEGGDEKEDETDDVDATLEVVKTSNKQEGQKAKLGETIEYTITVTNKGNVAFRNVKVDDELTGLHETIDELGVGASESFTTTYTVTEEDILNGHVRNVATAEGDKVPDPKNPDDPKKPAGEDEQDDPTDEPDASLTVVKSLTNRPNKGYFTLGETAEFDVVVTNTGNVTLKNIRLTEMLDGAEFVTGEGYTVKNGQAVIEELKPGQEDGDGQSVTVKATYTIQTKDLGMGVLKNIVAGEGEGPGKNPDDEGGTEFDVDYAKQVNAVKVWEDEENKHETRPAAITFVLMDESTGEELDRKDATAANEWSVSFDNLPAHDADGKEIIYGLKEIEVTGYDTRYGGPVEPTVAPPVIQGTPETDKGGEQIPGDAEQDEPVERDVHKIDQTIINTLRSHKLTIRYWVEVVGGQKAFDTYEKEYYYNEQYSVVSPGMYGYEPDLPRVQGRMPDEDLEIDVVYVRQIYKLTIYYIFEDGTTAHKEYEAKLYADEKFEVESPEINGYKPNLWMISGVMPDRNLNYTVIYIARTKPVEIQEAVAPLGVGSVVPNTGDCFD